jgi:hypothetical protein
MKANMWWICYFVGLFLMLFPFFHGDIKTIYGVGLLFNPLGFLMFPFGVFLIGNLCSGGVE